MNNNFTIVSNAYHLQHHGILGMKWGVRRYQNKDGSYTSAGRKRYGIREEEKKPGPPVISDGYQKTKEPRVNFKSNKEIVKGAIKQYKKRKAEKTVKALDKDIESLESIKNGMKDKKGRTILSEMDIKESIRALKTKKLNTVVKTDSYSKGAELTRKLISELSKDYIVERDKSTGQYSLKDRLTGKVGKNGYWDEKPRDYDPWDEKPNKRSKGNI